MTHYRIGIAGAGIAGLAAAAFLRRDGHDITIFERFDAPRPVGAGLMIQPTGLACLSALGLGDAAQALGRRIDGIHGRTASGTTIFDLAYRDIGYPCFAVAMHRASLFGLLHDDVKRLGVPIQTSTSIASTQLSDSRRTLVDEAGTTHGPFDIVIDATGMRSPLRATNARVWLNRPYPYGAVWGVAEEPADWAWKNSLRQCYDGCHVMIGILPIGRAPDSPRQLSAVFWSLRTADTAVWREQGIDAWRRRVIKLWPEVRPFVEQFTSVDELAPAAYADIWLAKASAPQLVFIGDAARAASPQLGQGANLALVDALMLARCLRQQSDITSALEDYARARRSHTRFYGVASRLLTPFFQSDSRVAAVARDATFETLARIPFVRREMVRMLAGVKTGPFSALDPATLHRDGHV
jgi:2-polyprenyl-6-methoxyphenol hydroxylase-like FAD-dependent oxidoreductase